MRRGDGDLLLTLALLLSSGWAMMYVIYWMFSRW